MHNVFELAALSAAFLVACSNNSSPTTELDAATVSGNGIEGNSVAGTPFTVADSATMVRTERRLANVVLSDFADTCSVADERYHPNSKQLTFLLADMDADAPPSAPGMYQIYTLENLPTTGRVGECGLAMLDATCRVNLTDTCESGTVTLTRVDGEAYVGTFDVMINGAHVTGAFDAPTCSSVSETGFGTCQ